ncbi:hypothetical protein [Streptomyces buecherae]|uniref:hypothetical protein n=1 Tax=Streptomyces buecherae TaxID=2763006 RepID=UPI003661068C
MTREFTDQAEEIAHHLAGHPHTEAGRPQVLNADQCALYRIGSRRHLGDIDTALATARRLHPAQLPTVERRARAATDTARALLDAGDVTGAFTQLRLVELAAPLLFVFVPAPRRATQGPVRRPSMSGPAVCRGHAVGHSGASSRTLT